MPLTGGVSEEVGFVQSTKGFLIYLDGLPNVKINEIIETKEGVRGWVSALYSDQTEALLLDDADIRPGQMFTRSNKILAIDAGDYLIGRVISPLGVPMDGKPMTGKSETSSKIDKPAPTLSNRQFIQDQLVTGITMIDTLLPLGKGQRELIFGDAHSGKVDFLSQIIKNQSQTGVICVYAAVGKPINEIRELMYTLEEEGALKHTTIVAASSTESAPLIFITPHTAFALAEYFQKKGKDVLVVLDDLGNHAKIHREIALLGSRKPGREAYPGDIFYQHAHLLERAGKFNKENGGGSISALPVIELNLNDFTTFIPTNLMAMTDGHLLFKSSLYNQGQRPAIDFSQSVTRVGRQTQQKLQNALADKVRSILAQATSLESISHFSAELPAETQLILKQRDMVTEIFKQDSGFIPLKVQTVLLGLALTEFGKEKDPEYLRKNKEKLAETLQKDSTLKNFVENVFEIKDLSQFQTKLVQVSQKLQSP